jgi:hypothetical protein
MVSNIFLLCVAFLLARQGFIITRREFRWHTRMTGIIKIVPRDPADAGERVDLFSIGDETYTMLAHPPGNLPLKYMEIVATKGVDIAVQHVMSVVLGEETWQAAVDCEDITKEQLAQLMDIVLKHGLGGDPGALGPKTNTGATPGSNGTRRPAGSRKR